MLLCVCLFVLFTLLCVCLIVCVVDAAVFVCLFVLLILLCVCVCVSGLGVYAFRASENGWRLA